MKRLMQLFFLFFITTQCLNAQSSRTFYIGLGGSNSSFQDLKYSSLRYGGMGGVFELHFKNSNENRIWKTGLTLTGNREAASLFDNGKAWAIYPQIHFSYLKSINEQLYIGGRWDVMEMYIRQTSGLGNNSIYYNTGSYLSASGLYKLTIKDQKFDISLDLGVLSYFKESTGFAFSAAQNALEDGEFDYQDEALTNPFGFKYFEVRPIWQHFRMSTAIDYQIGKRLSVGYRWNMRRFSEVEDRAVTTGANTISIRYHITHKRPETVIPD